MKTKSKWTKPENELPEPFVSVIILLTVHTDGSREMETAFIDRMGRWSFQRTGTEIKRAPIAWMPLPEYP